MTIAQTNVPRGKAMLIRTTGHVSFIDVPKAEGLAGAIGAESVDVVTLTLRGPAQAGLIMIYDEDGWDYAISEIGPGHFKSVPSTPRRPVNFKATALYREIAPTSVHQIVGDVLIMHDGDTPS